MWSLGMATSRADTLHLVDIVMGDLVVVFRQVDAAPVVEALDVATGDGEDHAADADVAAFLGAEEGVLQAGLDLVAGR